MVSGILYTDLSDHLPVFQITHLKMIYSPPPRKKQIRLINPTNIKSFRSRLARIDWSFLYNNNTTNNCYDAFSNHLIPIYNQSFPLITVNPATRPSSKPCFENNEYTVGIFVDLKKAFDTVNHNILFDKLYHYGICGIPLAWLSSYLSNRQQFVQIDNHLSSYNTIKCGVP